MITVMGATGNTGLKIAQALLEAGESVRAIGRTENKLAALARLGAETMAGDFADASFLTRAFRGADAVYTLQPTDRRAPNYRAQQDREGEAIAQAIRDSGVRYVVALSSLGGQLAEGTGVIAGLHAQEQRLRSITGVNILLLRPVSFFENLYDQLPAIQHENVIADSVIAELPIPMVAARDVADVAARALASRDWNGIVVRELIGERDLSYNDIARLIGQRIGKPNLQYVQLPYEAMVRSLAQAGLSESFARQYVEMTRSFNEGRVKPDVRTAENTTPTSFEDFADELASAARAAT